MIQTLEDTIRRLCAYDLELKYSDGFSSAFCTLIPALQLKDKTLIHSSSGKTPSMLEKGWFPILPDENIKKDLVNIDPTARGFRLMLDKERNHANKCTQDSF
ncbi:hypothetical protein O181_036193 [Austropuccinia psidii MF-1]|uniref:Uncharacterized protein n=1 Tax=Austropuccinia psidii MF-1 TaxID=1389203 RepID=A0A9Q3H8Z2_9BASI|nr:hypothetical protein [Austropuccinia psidii MF-1]